MTIDIKNSPSSYNTRKCLALSTSDKQPNVKMTHPRILITYEKLKKKEGEKEEEKYNINPSSLTHFPAIKYEDL